MSQFCAKLPDAAVNSGPDGPDPTGGYYLSPNFLLFSGALFFCYQHLMLLRFQSLLTLAFVFVRWLCAINRRCSIIYWHFAPRHSGAADELLRDCDYQHQKSLRRRHLEHYFGRLRKWQKLEVAMAPLFFSCIFS